MQRLLSWSAGGLPADGLGILAFQLVCCVLSIPFSGRTAGEISPFRTWAAVVAVARCRSWADGRRQQQTVAEVGAGGYIT